MKIITTRIPMTPLERAAGRYMRAPDHEGGEGGDDDIVADEPEPEPEGGEVNDDLEETGDGQPPAGDDSPPEGDEEGAPPKPDKAGEVEGRLAALEEQNASKDRDIAYWMGRANGTINEDGSPVKPEGEDDAVISPDDPDRPKPEDYQYGETDAGYITDLARYEANKAFEERTAQEQVKRQIDEVETTHASRVEEAKERYPDYDELVVAGANNDPATGQPKWFASPLMSLGIKTSEYGPDIAHDLASNPEESLRIAQLSPIEQAKEFGRLEYKAELAAKGRGGDSSEVRTSNAPTPPPRARGAGGGKGGVDPATDNFDEFEGLADAHAKKKSTRRR